MIRIETYRDHDEEFREDKIDSCITSVCFFGMIGYFIFSLVSLVYVMVHY